MRTHPFVEDVDLAPDLNGRRVCTCGLFEDNKRAHELPERSDEQKAAEARRIGEEA